MYWLTMESASHGGFNGCNHWHRRIDSNSGVAEQVEYEANVSALCIGTSRSLPR